jgi:hypothetical protein
MAQKSLISAFGKDLNDKMQVVYPAILSRKLKVRHNSSQVRLLFVANKF